MGYNKSVGESARSVIFGIIEMSNRKLNQNILQARCRIVRSAYGGVFRRRDICKVNVRHYEWKRHKIVEKRRFCGQNLSIVKRLIISLRHA